jgi:hypothetical protein
MGELTNSVTILDLETSWDTSAGIATRLPAGRPRSQGSIPSRGKRFYVFQNVQISSGVNTVSYTMGTRDYFRGDKVAEA